MKKNLSILVLLFFIFPKSVSAHVIGQPPFFKINGQYANLYPVPLTSLENFNLPQDLPPQNYLINDPLTLELDANRLPAPPNIIKITKFTWDFGDGVKGEGLKNNHTYNKIGSVILKIYADDGTTPSPQLIESALFNILPDKNYQLPKAVIKIDGKESKDPLTDILSSNFEKPLQLDATSSYSKSSKIVSYFWDFGDRQSSNQAETVHTYTKDTTQVFPVLRVKDANGFIGDNFLEIKNQNIYQNSALSGLGKKLPTTNSKPAAPSQLKYSVVVLVILVVSIFIYSRFLRKRKR